MKKGVVAVLLLFVSTFVMGQSQITGIVNNEKGKSLAFANVILKHVNNSTKIVKGTTTDLKGNYAFSNVLSGQYILGVVYMGYRSQFDTVTIKGKDVSKNFSLQRSVNSLRQVEVKSSSVTNGINKVTFYTTRSDIKNANNSFTLLEKIPKLIVNNMENTITTVKGSKVKILINGMNSNETDLMAIKPGQVIKIEYYNIPPARYSNLGFDAVIDVITKKSQQGISGVINFKNAVATAFGDDLFDIKYNKKNAQWGLSYYLSYRDLYKVTSDETLHYRLNGLEYQKVKTGINSPKNYFQNKFELHYLYQKDSSYSFRIKLTPYYRPSSKGNIQNLNYTYSKWGKQPEKKTGIGNTADSSNDYRCALDVYFDKNLKKNQKLIFDVVSTYFNTRYRNLINEVLSGNDTILHDDNTTKSNKISTIGEGLFIKHFAHFKVNFGLRFSFAHSKQTVSNMFGKTYFTTKTSKQYAYSEFTGKIKKLSYDLSIGISRNTYTENSSQYNYYIFRPSINIGYPVTEKSSFTLTYSREPNIPDISLLSSNKFLIDQNIIYAGNPNLKPYASNDIDLAYSLQLPRLYFSTDLEYYYAKNTIFSNFIRKDTAIYYIPENQKWENGLYWDASVNYTPFKSGIVNLSLNAGYYMQGQETNTNKKNQINGFAFSGTIQFNYKDFHLKGQYSPSYYSISDQYVSTTQPYSYLGAYYKKQNIKIGCGLLFPFSKSWHISDRTFNNSLVHDRDANNIYDIGNMFVLNFSYNFSSGRKYQEGQKIIQNSDNASGVLKAK